MSNINEFLQKIRTLPRIALPHLYNIASDLGVVNGHKDYKRFIVLGRSRTGSNFLRGLLNAHGQAYAFGELFQTSDKISWGIAGYRDTAKYLALFQHDPVQFLETAIYRDVPTPIQAVGFKLFYYHAHTEVQQPVWEYLAAQRDLHVIHIKRRNMLKMSLSRQHATKTSRWIRQSTTNTEIPKIALDYEKCLADFTQTRKWEIDYEHFFAKQPLLTVQYESLADDYQAEMVRIQDFLGVQPRAVKPQTYRQAKGSLKDSILNYDELAERFAGTEWQAFFEE